MREVAILGYGSILIRTISLLVIIRFMILVALAPRGSLLRVRMVSTTMPTIRLSNTTTSITTLAMASICISVAPLRMAGIITFFVEISSMITVQLGCYSLLVGQIIPRITILSI